MKPIKSAGFLALWMPAMLIAMSMRNQWELKATPLLPPYQVAFTNHQGPGSASLKYTPSNVISLVNAHDMVIKGKAIAGGTTASITLINCTNIHITENKLYNSTNVGIHLTRCKNITVDHNYFTNVSTGVYVDVVSEGGIVINNNQFLNMKGPYPRGQFVQFDKVNGPNNCISYNKCENMAGQSFAEDGISLYKSSGTAASPIMITGNWIRGGGPSKTGGGIMLGDNGGSYLTATGNVLVDPGQYGMAISGGDHIVMLNNIIYGRSQHFTNVGLYVAGLNGYNCKNSTVKGNKVRYLNNESQENDSWKGPNADNPIGWDTNNFKANIDASVLPRVIITYK